METRFQEYINYVCGGIRSRKQREAVADELLSHLEERYEQNRAIGQDEYIAQKLATEQMGDREKLRLKFAALYSFYTPDYMRTALNCFLFGLFFIFTRLNLFPLSDKILPFAGQMLILYAIFRLYGINKQTKAAAWVYAFYLLAENLHLFLMLYFAPNRMYVYVTGIAAVLLLTFVYSALLWGLDAACCTNTVYGDKAPHLLLCALALWWNSFFLCLLAVNGDPISAAEWSEIGIWTCIPLLITFLGFRRAKKILCHSEPEFTLENPPTKHSKQIFAAILCAFLLLPFGAMCGAALRTPPTVCYTTADTEESDETIQAARQHLLDLGLPTSVLNDLPDSEVLRYRTTQHMETETLYSKSVLSCEIYIFYITEQWVSNDESLSEGVRVLYAFNGFDNQKVHLRDGFYFQLAQEDFLGFAPNKLQTFHLILGEKDETTYRAQPFLSFPDTDTYANAYAGFDFAFPKGSTNRRAYFANSGIIQSPSLSKISYVRGEYYHQCFPLYIEYRNNEERAISRFSNRTFHAGIYSVTDIQQYDSFFDYQPAFYGIRGEWRFVEDTDSPAE